VRRALPPKEDFQLTAVNIMQHLQLQEPTRPT
jgi:hypothetical protein